ncbi:DNA-binding protein [Pedobacter sp. HMWF019]|uniref:helix-turn-helix domain-containing protein n=1 Tax=Pedobacter sp. HMWF019 TaxID=2056856 RepID=UPI000D36E82B|nr:helix-turn-helix domain-containing protein [Pedobacter sp. HMWF019]PTS95115.1 DNA-binding protein [Pedobacter sp. HMWF019]
MNAGKEFLFFFSALGAFNGLVLSAYFLFFTRKKYLANYFLGALLFALSIRIGKSVLFYFDGHLPKIYLQIGLSACFFIGPCLYFFIKSSLVQAQIVPKSWKWCFVGLIAFVLIVGAMFPYESRPDLWNAYFANAIYVQWFVFLVATGILLKGRLKKLFSKEERLKTSETWLFTVFFGNIIVFLFYFLALVRVSFSSYIIGAVVFSFILYLIIFILLYRNKTDDLFSLSPNKYSGKKVNDQDASILLVRLDKMMMEKQVYKDPDLKLNDLSKGIQISGHQLSQLLNDNLGKNFTTFVNEFRIQEACKIISSNDQLTLESVGYDVGFNSKSTFFAAFKKIKGTTPAVYQQRFREGYIAVSTDL